MHSSRPPKRFSGAFTLVELLVVIAIIGILVALLLPAVQAAREAARRAQCTANIKNVALAVLNYESANGDFPAAISKNGVITSLGVSTDYESSWLIDTLPYLESQTIYDTFDFSQPMTGGTLSDVSAPNFSNVQARSTPIAVIKCPSDGNNEIPFGSRALGGNWARGNYAGNVGAGFLYSGGGGGSPTAQPIADTAGSPNAIWKGGKTNNTNWPSSVRGIFGPNTNVRIAQISDGTSKTMMIGEIRAGIEERDYRGAWALPHAGGSTLAAHGSGGDANGPNNCFAQGAADDKANTFTDFSCTQNHDALLAQCMTCSDSPGAFGAAQAAPRSTHPGGVIIALADGSAKFLNDDIEVTGWFGRCCSPWDHLIMAADENFVIRGR